MDDATAANGQAGIYKGPQFTVAQNNAYAVFDYRQTGFTSGDKFTWKLQRLDGGDWVDFDSGTNADSTYSNTTNANGNNVFMASQFLENGATYRYVFEIEDTTGSNNYQVYIDNVRLHYADGGTDNIIAATGVGEGQIIMNGAELVDALQTLGGNDTINGGAGNDIIFGDTINSDWLTWTGRNLNASTSPDGRGSGILALDEFLIQNGLATGAGNTVTKIDRYNYIKDHHVEFSANGLSPGGNDTLYGDEGNDILYGQGGNDTLYGGADNDILHGGKGSDILFGGTGADTFAWAAGDIGTTLRPDLDTIKDFNLAEGDLIDATALLTDLGWNGTIGTLSQFVSVSGSTINIHDTGNTKSVNIVVENLSFSSLNDMISKTDFQT